MKDNLLQILKGYITPEVISKASSTLGESEDGVSKAITSLIPTVLNGLVHKTDDTDAMGNIYSLLKQNNSHSDNILSNITSLLSGNENSNSIGIGSKLIDMLFGDKMPKINDMVSNSSGIKSASTTALLGMITPMIMSHFGKTGISLAGLTSLLTTQKSAIVAARPVGLNAIAGFANVSSRNLKEDNTTSGFPKWLFPVLLIGAALVALYFLTKSCNKVESVSAPITTSADSLALDASKVIDSTVANTTTVVTDATAALGKFFSFKLPNGVELNAPEKGIENQLVTWMSDKTKVVDKTTWFNFDRLLFETGKSTLKPESQEQLKNISEIMKAFPTVEIKLGGYTDNTGDAAANLKLSGERANTVMAELVKLGVAKSRVAAEGYGIQFPVATNDTEEGRAQNRRIAVRVTKK